MASQPSIAELLRHFPNEIDQMIRIGDRAKTRGPLKPLGEIRLGEMIFAAASSGEWIDTGEEVEIVGGSEDRVLVRAVLGNQNQLRNHGQPLPAQQQQTVEALEAPPAWVEKINSVKIGAVAGVIVGLIVWAQGEPLSLSALSVPLAGVVSGWVFHRLVAIPAEAAGPRADHRPLAIGIAFGVCFTTIIGAVIGFDVSGTFLGTSLGLFVGAVAAGIVIFMLFVISHL